MSKSIDQVWREMQQRRQVEMQRQILLEKQEQEKRERSRQEYLSKMRMFEVNTSVASSAAAGAAGGAGGGGKKKLLLTTSVSQESVIYFSNDDGFKYFIYNFENNKLTDILTLPEGSGTLQNNTVVTNGGYFFTFSDGSSNKFYFIDLDGQIIWQDFNISGDYYEIENFSRYVAPYYYKDGMYKLVIIDKNNTIKTFDFDNYIEGGGYSYDDVWTGGIVVAEYVDAIRKYYIVDFEAGTKTQFKVIDTDLGESLNVYQYGFSEKIITRKDSTLWEVWNSSGIKITEFDVISEYSTSNWTYYDFSFLDANGSILIFGFDNDNSQHTVIFFSGASDVFTNLTFSSSTYNSFVLDNVHQKNYKYPNGFLSGGSALIYAANTNNNINCSGFGYNSYNAILPIWSTDAGLRTPFTFSNEMAINTNLDSNNCCIIRNSDYIITLMDNQPYGIYYFSDEGNGYSNGQINDGGFDMYDNGNRIYADDVQLDYTHTQMWTDRDQGMVVGEFNMNGQIVTEPIFGLSSSAEFFTNCYPGLFVACAQNIEIDKFKIDGNTGADNIGTLDNFNFQVATNSNTYQVFVKQTFDIKEPSINHIIIVNAATSSGITQSIGGSTDEDLHILEGLAAANVTEIYYLLMSQFAGQKIEYSDVVAIAETFLNIRETSASISDLLANLNNKYSDITGILPQRGPLKLLRFNREGTETTILDQELGRNFEDNDRLGDASVLQYINRINLPGKFGWDILTDFEERKFSTLKAANRNAIGNYVVGQEFVMKDVTNNQYWGIQFTQWTQNNNGGGFAYTRQLIENGSFTGSVISFTNSNYGEEVDIISEGVLEITRANNGAIYNKALENESNGYGPLGTLWNAEEIYTYRSYEHELISRDGSLVNVVSTEEYNNNWQGDVYHLFDEVNQTNYICTPNGFGNSFEGIYNSYNTTPDAVRESGLYSGNAIINTERGKFRILTSTSISSEFEISISIEFGKIESVNMCETGALIITYDSNGFGFYFYNLNGELIFSKTDLSLLDPYEVTNYGTRLSVQYPLQDGILRYLFFNGTSVTEYSTGLTNYFVGTANVYQAILP
jgi:hypothetical protein